MVYVDDMKAKYGNMIMFHMLADTEEELLEMAKKIGVNEKWWQFKGTPKSHFDICQSKKLLALSFGAKEVTRKEVGLLLKKRRQQ